MIITGITIIMLNFIAMGAVLLLDFKLFSRLTSAADSRPQQEPLRGRQAQKKSSLQTVA